MAYTTINKSSEHFNTKLYTGNNADGNAITGVGHSPDFVWIKQRNAMSHRLYDKIRGVNSALSSDNSDAANQYAGYGQFESFDSDGFTVGVGTNTDGTQGYGTNQNSQSIASWNWKANGAGSANTDGSLNSTVSANATSGFSISTWNEISSSSAQTIGHGLGVAPDMMIMKRRNEGGSSWLVYHKSIGNTGAVFLDGTASTSTSSSYWNNTSPTSSVFTLGAGWNASSSYNWVSYNFKEKQGYSKFGSYTGNGNADGTFVYTGFKPAFILSKDADAAENWFIQDTTRNTSNPVGAYLRPNLSDAEGTFNHYDILSNGFKNLYAGGSLNVSGRNIIYMAFAEAPLVGTNNVPCTAR